MPTSLPAESGPLGRSLWSVVLTVNLCNCQFEEKVFYLNHGKGKQQVNLTQLHCTEFKSLTVFQGGYGVTFLTS